MNAGWSRLYRYIPISLLVLSFLCSCKDNVTSRSRQFAPPIVVETKTLARIDTSASTAPVADGSAASRISVYFQHQGLGVAYAVPVQNGFQVVHLDKRGPIVQSLDAVAISPDGSSIAYSAMHDGMWKMFVNGADAGPSASVTMPVFSNSGAHLVYGAKRDTTWYLFLDGQKITEGDIHIESPYFNSEGTLLVYAAQKDQNKPLQLIVSELATKKTVTAVDNCGTGLVLSPDKSQAAAIQQIDRQQRVARLTLNKASDIKFGQIYDIVGNLTFSPDGKNLAYIGIRGGKRFIVLNSKENALPEGNIPFGLQIFPNGQGVACLLATQGGFRVHQAFSSILLPQQPYDEAEGLVVSPDSRRVAFAARRGDSWFIIENGVEGPVFDRAVSPKYSPDGSMLVYRVRKDNKRFVVVTNLKGQIIKQFQPYEMIQEPVFSSDGKVVAYGVKDGDSLIWKVEKL